MQAYEDILHKYGRTEIQCRIFQNIPNFNSRKRIVIGETYRLVSEHEEVLDCIVDVLQTEPRTMGDWSRARDKSKDVKLCEIRLGQNFKIDSMTVELFQCCENDEKANFTYMEPPNEVDCTHIIIWVKDKTGAHPHQVFTILDGEDIEAIYDPLTLHQWEYDRDDESVTVSQFHTEPDVGRIKEKLASFVQSSQQDIQDFQDRKPNDDLPSDMDEEDRTLYMQELQETKAIYEKRLSEYNEEHHSYPRKIILKTMKCSEAFRFSRNIPNKSDKIPTGFMLWKHGKRIVLYTCAYINGWPYELTRPLAAMFVTTKGSNTSMWITNFKKTDYQDFGTKFAELNLMYNTICRQRKQRYAREQEHKRRNKLIELKDIFQCQKMFMKCIASPAFGIYQSMATTSEEVKFFDNACSVSGSIFRMHDDARRVRERFNEPHKQNMTSYDPMGNSEQLRLYETIRTSLQSMLAVMEKSFVNFFKTFRYEDHPYDMVCIMQHLLRDAEEGINVLGSVSSLGKRSGGSGGGGAGGVNTQQTSLSNLLICLNKMNV